MAEQFRNFSFAKQRRMKLALEKRFKPEIKKVFHAILQDFRVSIVSSRMPPNSRRFLPAWNTLLDIHYRRTQKLFLKAVEFETKQRTEEEDEKEKLLLLALLTWREQNVAVVGEELAFTTRVNMTESLQEAQEQFRSEGKIPTDRELAYVAGAILRKKFKARVTNIAISETQNAAESTKFIKAEVQSGVKPTVLGGQILPVFTTVKIWMTRRDSKVRPAHAKALFQQQPLNRPFKLIFNGREELLNFPRDTSLGASVGNIAGCRCTTIYKKVKSIILTRLAA